METRGVLVVSIVVLVAGCTQIPGFSDNNNNGELESKATGPGLQITQFSISDSELNPGQIAVITLKLKNHHIDPVTINKMQLFNFGPNWQFDGGTDHADNCAPSELRPAKKGLSPEMECTWQVTAPTKEELGSFDSRTFNPKLLIDYNAQVSNKKQPFKINFKSASEIEDAGTITRTYSNGEVKMEVSIDTPVPIEGSTTADIVLDSASSRGQVVSDQGYQLSISPDLVDSCTSSGQISEGGSGGSASASTWQVNPVVEDRVEVSCIISPESAQKIERNLIFSTSYKYQKFPSLTIEVTN